MQPLQWGRIHEKTAIAKYEARTGNKVQRCGLFLAQSGMLGGSPDGFFEDPSGERVLIEVKCPWKHRDRAIRAAVAADKQFCLQVNENEELSLKPQHKYMHQIQGCLHLTNAVKCHFVVWTEVDMAVVCVRRDPTWHHNLYKLESFYKSTMIPQILRE